MTTGRTPPQGAVSTQSVVVALAVVFALTVVTSCSMMMSSVGSKLANTEWRVIAMTGFPPENVAGGTFKFGPDRVWMSNGNDFSCEVTWDDTGFTPTDGCLSTDVGYPLHHPYLELLLGEDEHHRVDLNEDGTITLTRQELVVVAEKM